MSTNLEAPWAIRGMIAANQVFRSSPKKKSGGVPVVHLTEVELAAVIAVSCEQSMRDRTALMKGLRMAVAWTEKHLGQGPELEGVRWWHWAKVILDEVERHG